MNHEKKNPETEDSVTIRDTMESFEYGKLIHILDIEGNKKSEQMPDKLLHLSSITD